MSGMEEDLQMTEVQGNVGSTRETSSRPRGAVSPQVVGKTRNSNVQAIGAGMAFILSEQRNDHWSDSLPGGADVLITAYVLARLGEVPYDLLSDAVRLQMRKALNWLIAVRSPGGGWGRAAGTECDAASTALGVIAVGRQNCRVSAGDLDVFRACQRASDKSKAPEIAAAPANALTGIIAEGLDRLAHWFSHPS